MARKKTKVRAFEKALKIRGFKQKEAMENVYRFIKEGHEIIIHAHEGGRKYDWDDITNDKHFPNVTLEGLFYIIDYEMEE